MFHFHKYEDIKTEISKNICFGLAGAEMPGYRLTQQCKVCKKIRYISLNIAMPDKYLYDEKIWK